MLKVFAVGQRVGTLEFRRVPDRLVSRFGTVTEGPKDAFRPREFVPVLWDDGEDNLVEKSALRSMVDMYVNPNGLPIVGFLDEVAGRLTGHSLRWHTGLADDIEQRLKKLARAVRVRQLRQRAVVTAGY